MTPSRLILVPEESAFANNVGSTDSLETLTIDSDGSVDFDGTIAVAGNIDIDGTTASFDNTVSTTAGVLLPLRIRALPLLLVQPISTWMVLFIKMDLVGYRLLAILPQLETVLPMMEHSL